MAIDEILNLFAVIKSINGASSISPELSAY